MKYFDGNTWFWMFLAGILFIPFLGAVPLFDWSETQFAEVAREMLITGDYLRLQINFEIFTGRPPLFFWFQQLSMQTFGVGEFAARFPNALLGIVVLPFLYISGKFLIDRKFGFLWALSWFGSILPFMYFKSGLIEPYFTFFSFAGIFFLMHYIWKKNSYRDLYFSRSAQTYLWLAGIFIGLAILTKGPMAYLITILVLVLVWISGRFRPMLPIISFVKFSVIALLVSLLWFSLEIFRHGPDFIIEFALHQWGLLTDNGQRSFAGYHFVVLLLGCFPASIFAIRGLWGPSSLAFHVRDFHRWMIILLIVVLVLFNLAGPDIAHYSSLAYYPISFLSALAIWNILERRGRYPGWITVFIVLIGAAIVIGSWAVPYVGTHPEVIMGYLEENPFAQAALQAEIPWSAWDYLPGTWMLIVLTGFLMMTRRTRYRAFKLLFFGTGLWVMLALVFFTGKVEQVTQGPAVEFFADQQEKDVYITSYGYQTYVPWFYARIEPYETSNPQKKEWLLFGDTDKPVMISAKITSREKLEEAITDAEFLYEKNGFVFYRRN